MQVIAELDEKKREALEKTWTKVNKDFGSIFGTLLHGCEAKLEPPEGQSFLAGGRPRHAVLCTPAGALQVLCSQMLDRLLRHYVHRLMHWQAVASV